MIVRFRFMERVRYPTLIYFSYYFVSVMLAFYFVLFGPSG
jgi:hypothetical protein